MLLQSWQIVWSVTHFWMFLHFDCRLSPTVTISIARTWFENAHIFIWILKYETAYQGKNKPWRKRNGLQSSEILSQYRSGLGIKNNNIEGSQEHVGLYKLAEHLGKTDLDFLTIFAKLCSNCTILRVYLLVYYPMYDPTVFSVYPLLCDLDLVAW